MSRRGQDTRARIAAAALELLRERGSAGLTMRQVATRTGLSLSNVQYHFKFREQLLVGITEHHLELCSASMRQGLEAAGEVTLASVLRVSLCDEAVRATAPAFRELFALARVEAGVRERLDAHYAHSLEALVELLGSSSDAPRERLFEVGTLVMTSIEGAYLLASATPVSPERLAACLEEAVDRMLAGA